MAPVVKSLPAYARDVRDVSSIPGLGRSPRGGHGNPLQYFLPEESPWSEEPGRLQSIHTESDQLSNLPCMQSNIIYTHNV